MTLATSEPGATSRLTFTPRNQKSIAPAVLPRPVIKGGGLSGLSYKPRSVADPPAVPKSPCEEDAGLCDTDDEDTEEDCKIYGDWEMVDPNYPSMLSRRIKNVCEVRFKDSDIKLNRKTVEAAKTLVGNDDFHSNDAKLLGSTIYRFYNRCHQDLFNSVRIKMIIFQGDY